VLWRQLKLPRRRQPRRQRLPDDLRLAQALRTERKSEVDKASAICRKQGWESD